MKYWEVINGEVIIGEKGDGFHRFTKWNQVTWEVYETPCPNGSSALFFTRYANSLQEVIKSWK